MKQSIRISHPVFKILAVVLVVAATAAVLHKPVQGRDSAGIDKLPASHPGPAVQPRIQMAILLDTSNSMDGLIDQARNQLWQVVNEFAGSKKNGMSPALEVAVYEYGNSNLPAADGYVRQVTGLTRDLDRVSEVLFSLTTNGGDEYCGYVIDRAVRELQWDDAADNVKVIFIAGNEPFTQGPVSYRTAVALAKEKDITVNTIYAGNYKQGISSSWQDGALLAGGNYMSIDQNRKIVHVAAPQDKKLALLNRKLNNTYVPYGAKGKTGSRRQQAVDDKNKSVSPALMAERVQSKASAFYNSSDWDLVDAVKSGTAELKSLAPKSLPAEMQKMNEQEKKEYIKSKAEERSKIKKEIAVLSRERDAFVAESKRQQAEPEPVTMDTALSGAIRQQLQKKHYQLENKHGGTEK